ncbi:MAG: single-stranded-DNA-specific exonuclease RecJ [Ruminococcus sp.]|nr:single-stranded-DNA-specific exonuclease RecJ [Ruminococcus sp.]
MKKWKISEYDKNTVDKLRRRCDLMPLVLKVLNSRGFDSVEAIAEFINGSSITDPYEIKDMKEAVDTINTAIDDYSLICIYGDYDCDGVSATAILFSYLENIGANVMYYIPERSDGYGMSISAVEMLAERDVKLIVTVDNGISAIAEAERIYELGMKLVVTDHHQPLDKLPRAEAVVDPHRADCPSKDKNLCGAGVALKLCIALNEGNTDMIMEQYSDICAMATVADIVPLKGENRTIVKTGLEYMKNTENYGLDHLMDAAGVKREQLNATTISFQLAPRINASGRFGTPITAVKALLAEDEEDAEMYVETMVTLNEQRKKTESEIYNAIMKYLDAHPEELCRRVLILAGNNWHLGVIGIVASKLTETFGKPVILLSIDKNRVARGSGRGVKGFDVFKCLLAANGEDGLLDHFGGHEGAGGLTLSADRIPEFTKRVYRYTSGFPTMPTAVVECDLTLAPEDLTIENVKALSVLEPFGSENVRPLFVMTGAVLNRISSMSQGKHSRLELTYGDKQISVAVFGKAPEELFYPAGCRLDLAVNLDINVYNDKESINFRLVDCRYSGIDQERYFNARDCYEKFTLGEELPSSYIKVITPTRDELVRIYKVLSALGQTNLDSLYARTIDRSMNLCKLNIIIDAFVQTGLAVYSPSTGIIKLLPAQHKVDINSARVLEELRSRS